MENMVAPASFWKGRAVLVTGAAGLVGSWLVSELISLKLSSCRFYSSSRPTVQLLPFWYLQENICGSK